MISRLIRWATCAAVLACLTGTAMAQDTYPLGTFAFFNLPNCPPGWAPAVGKNDASLNGYFVVPFVNASGVAGTTVNPPLGNGEDRTHTHSFASSIKLPEVKYVGIVGCCNNDTSNDGTMSFSGTTGASDSGMPYVQLLACMKSQFSPTRNPPVGVPQEVVAFYAEATCPTGWKPQPITAGRFLLGLPPGGQPVVAFGGDVLAPQEDRQHTHGFAGSVNVSSAGVGLGSGCCAEHYGATGTYQYSGTTGAASTGLPYAIMTQCQPCVTNDQDPNCTNASNAPR